jgi:hypothetical protein
MATVARLVVSNVLMTITLLVFTDLRSSTWVRRWNTASLVCLIGAVAFAFWHA